MNGLVRERDIGLSGMVCIYNCCVSFLCVSSVYLYINFTNPLLFFIIIGPKFICGVDVLAAKSNSTSDGCLVYSIGSNNQIEFEEATFNHIGCEIHTFDPTLDKPFVGDKYATFHPWGLGEDGAKMSGNRKD